MSAQLAVQKALRARLVASPGVTALVPADAIIDRNKRPAPSPSIVLGESQAVDEGESIARQRLRVFHTVHVWKQEPSLTGATAICAQIRAAVMSGRFDLSPAWHCADVHIADIRTMRDRDGETSHGVVTVDVQAVEVAP